MSGGCDRGESEKGGVAEKREEREGGGEGREVLIPSTCGVFISLNFQR